MLEHFAPYKGALLTLGGFKTALDGAPIGATPERLLGVQSRRGNGSCASDGVSSMLADTLSITYNAVAITLNKVKEANYTSTYYAENGTNKYTLDVKHTIPAAGQDGESHLVKLTVEYFDASGVYQKSCSPWFVVKTFDASQNSTDALRAANALVGLLTSAFLTNIVGRMS